MIAGARQRHLEANCLEFTAWEMGEGPLVLCLHGFPDTARTWRLTLPTLSRAGFRVVAVSLRGYEPSSQPADNDYSTAALASDVAGWMDALGETRCHLLGHDWGASIAYAAAASLPARIHTLTTLAVPHPAAFAQAFTRNLAQLHRSGYIIFFQFRGWAEGVVARRDFAYLERLWRRWSPGWDIPSEDLAAMKRAFAQPGVLVAALSYYRQAFDQKHRRFADTTAIYATKIAVPTLGLVGELDGCISASVFERAMPPAMFTGGLAVERIEGAGHFLHLERPDRVHAAILAHLRAAASAPTQPGFSA